MDSHSFAAPARVRTLLVPVGNITASQFHKYSQIIRSALEVRLVDVTGTKSRVFNPQSFPQGRVFYDFQTSVDGTEALFLQDFEPYRKTFVVIGVSNDDVNENDITQLKKIYKTVLVHSTIVFGDQCSFKDDSVFHYSKTNVETIMCEITRLFLQQLTEYHDSYQHLTLRSPGSVGENDPNKFLSKQKKRISSGTALSLSLSDPSLNKISLSTSNERRQSRVKGRQLKILGNLYLLAGNYHAALTQFQESILLLKSSYDYLWLGSALEGISISIFLHSYVESSYDLTPALIKIIKQQQILQQQSASSLIAPATNITPLSSPRSSVSSFMAGNVESLTNVPPNDLIYQLMTKVFDFYERSRYEIEDYVPNLVYCDTILRLLKYMTVLNLNCGELINPVYDHILKGKKIKVNKSVLDSSSNFDRSNILKISNKIFQIEFKKLNILSQIKIYSSLSSIFQDLSYFRKRAFLIRSLLLTLIPEITDQSNEHSANDLTSLLNSLLSIYGIDSTTDSIIDGNPNGWIKLHKSIIQLSSSICDKIKEFKSSILLKSLLLTRYLNSLTDNEQITIFNDLKSIIKNNPNLTVYYFDPYIIRDVKLNTLSNPPKKELKPKDDSHKNRKDPLIYNPYAAKSTVSDIPLLVQGEISELILTIQNPFAFQLEINDIKISHLEIIKKSIIIPPKKILPITIQFKPIKSGNFDISSIQLQILECALHHFKIVDSMKPEIFHKLKGHDNSDNKDNILLKFKKNLFENNIDKRTDLIHLKFNVIDAQPSLQLLSPLDTTLLIEGGKAPLSLRLKNTSNIDINYLKFSNWDSTEGPLKLALEDRILNMNDINEIEYFLIKDSMVIQDEILEIGSFQEIDLNIEVFGKRGLTTINLFIDYGHTIKGSDEIYLRRLSIVLPISVTNCIELASCDIIPLSCSKDSYPIFENWKPKDAFDYVLFILDLRNIWNKSININVELFDYTLTGMIVPLETKRLILPIKRFKIGKIRESMKVPSLLKKQYILATIPKAEDMFLKQIFWYRQEILDNIKGTWSADNEIGDIEFRGIRITQKMLNFLTIDDVLIEFELVDIDYTKCGSNHCIKTDNFFTVNVNVINNSDKKIKGILRSIPLSLTYGSIEKRLVYNGTLQRIIPKPIEVGESFQFQIGAVALETGDYEFGAIFDEYGSDSQYVSRFPLRIRAT